MTVTMKDIPAIINDLKKQKPATLAKDSDRPLSPKEAIMQLAPTLLKKKEDGLTTAELVDFLAKHHISVKAHNLARYLREYSSFNTPSQLESTPQAPRPVTETLKADEHNNSLNPNDSHG